MKLVELIFVWSIGFLFLLMTIMPAFVLVFFFLRRDAKLKNMTIRKMVVGWFRNLGDKIRGFFRISGSVIKIFLKIAFWLALIALVIGFILALGPLWIIAILMVVLILVVINR